MAATWLSFWQEKNEFDEAMCANYHYFLARVSKHISLCPSLKILDIGSGPGHLADAWHDKVAEIHGVDISKRYNELARAKHANRPGVRFYDLSTDDYLNFGVIAGQRFDAVIVMSVVQYYKNAAEAEQLLTNIKQVAAPGAKALICDLIVKDGVGGDLLSILGRSLRQGELLKMLGLLFRLRFSAYYTVRKNNGLLIIPQTEWLAMCNRLDLNARFVAEPLTMQQERMNLLIQF